MTNDYLDTTIDTYNRNVDQYIQATTHLVLEPEMERFSRSLKKNDLILDAGCGFGRDSKLFIEQGFRVIGIDLSDGLLKEATQLVPQATFKKMDVRHLDFPDNQFNAIWACAVIHHLTVDDMKRAFKEFIRVLKPSGTFFMNVKGGNQSSIRQEPFTAKGDRFFTLLEPEQLQSLLVEAGFKVDDTYLVNERERFGPDKRDQEFISVFAQK